MVVIKTGNRSSQFLQELPIPGEPVNQTIPLRESGIQFSGTRILLLRESGIKYQIEYGVCGIKHWRRLARKPHAEYNIKLIRGTNGLRVCATTQPRKLPTNNVGRPRASAQN